MGYIWNLVKGDIDRLKSLFSDLSKISGEDDELQKKWVELKKLLRILTEMVCNSEKQYKVDDEEKQDEGSVLADEEKQHVRSVLELKKHERIVLELWLEELQDAVFNMEDLVDKIHKELQDAVFNMEDLVDKIHKEALRHKLDAQICEKMEDIRCSLESYVKQGDVLGLAGQTYIRCLMNLQGMQCPDDDDDDDDDRRESLHDLMKRLDDDRMESPHDDRMKSLDDDGMESESLDDDRMESRRKRLDPTDYIYFVDESEVFGMDCDKEEIIKLLLPDDASDKQLSVISIEGNGQIGKTTLARLVYNDKRVSHHFHLKAWVGVQDDFYSVTRSILNFFTLQYKDLEVSNLQEYVGGKRFLLILDGAKQTPSSTGWEALQDALKDAANGSCIIVTRRNKDIAPMMDAVSTYRMEPLSEERSWSIFAKSAFRDQNPTPDTQLEVIGKEIVQMCHGLPSSVRILGSLLRFKPQQEEWEAILKRLKPSSYSGENFNVSPAYLILPEHLQRCLAYCSIFSQDYEFVKDKLILLWMAEGFIKYYDENFHKLKPFFKKSSGTESSFLICVNNLAAYVSTRYCYRLEDNHPSHIPLNTRYLSLVGGKYENSVIFEAIDRTKHLRAFLALDHEPRHLCATELQNLLSKLQFLRVLSLSHYHITEIPDSIGNLKPLRYIDLSHTAIKRLPASVCELYNLLSLILLNCQSLTKLPENTSKLENLYYLEVSGSGLSEMPKGMRKLKNLRLLPCFIVGKESDSPLKEFCHMEFEGKLHISKLQNVICDDRDYTPLLRMCRLKELVLEWDDNTADPEYATKVLARLIPNWCLEKLTINFYCGTDIANFFIRAEFNRMVFLRLSNCKNCSALPRLEMQGTLRVLIIECMYAVEEVGPDFSAEPYTGIYKPFKSLERLTFEGMSKWTKWDPLDEFPRLKQLCIRRCPKLRGNLPKLLPSVERVEISESQELVTALTTEASLNMNNLHYRDKIVFISDDKVNSFTSEGATGSSSLMIEGEKGAPESLVPSADGVVRTSVPITQGAAESSLLLLTDGITQSSLPVAQDDESSLLLVEDVADTTVPAVPITQGTEESEADVLSDTWSPFESTKVSEISELMALPTPLHSLKIEGCDDLTFIPKSVIKNPSLQHLYIINCCSLESFPYKGMALKILYIRNCKKLYFPLANENIQLGKLEDLSVGSSCDSLTDLFLHLFPKLRSLSIWDCEKLQKLSMPQNSKIKLTSLEALEIRDCPNLKNFPTGGLPTPNLKSIWFSNCKSLEKLPDQLSTLECLKSMFINDCPELESLSKQVLPPKLSLLKIISCNKLISGEGWGLHGLTSLCQLEIEGECKNVKSFPVEGLLPSNLSSLRISGLSDLEKLDNTGIKKLESLKTLEISCCEKLQSLPVDGFPSSLSFLCIKKCPLLKPKLQNKNPKLQNKNREDRSKIAHISCVEIDEEVIS